MALHMAHYGQQLQTTKLKQLSESSTICHRAPFQKWHVDTYSRTVKKTQHTAPDNLYSLVLTLDNSADQPRVQLLIFSISTVADPWGLFTTCLPSPYKTTVYNAKLTIYCFAIFQSTSRCITSFWGLCYQTPYHSFAPGPLVDFRPVMEPRYFFRDRKCLPRHRYQEMSQDV